MADQERVEQVWLPVIGRALAYLCMRNGDAGGKTIAEKAQFLMGLGLDANDAADMLGTTAASVKELIRQAKNKTKRGAKKGAASKKASRKNT